MNDELEAEGVARTRRRELHNGELPGVPIEIEEVGDVDEDATAEEERAEREGGQT